MIKKDLPLEFMKAQPVIEALEQGGFEAYFVGGSVRDILLNQVIHDVDIATSAYPEEVKGLFQRTIDVGIDHGTVLVLYEEDQYEITTFRTESTYQDYRRPDSVTFVRSLAEDLKRRDFTINALAMNQQGEVIDLFDGMTDLANRLIRAVGLADERFNEDALRMMRGLRFASQLDFEIEKETFAAIAKHHALLGKISVERIQVEFVKMMLGKKRNRGLQAFIDTQCFRYCPELQDKQEGLAKLVALPAEQLSEEVLVWLLTVHCLELQQQEIKLFLTSWKNSNHMIKQVSLLHSGLAFRLTQDWSNQWLYDLGAENIQLLETALPYFNEQSKLAEALNRYEKLPIHKIQDIQLTGKDLLALIGQRPGPWVGQVLAVIQQQLLAGEVSNQPEELSQLALKVYQQLNA
ncbi:CCA tRNA nucleotidyltransferase [Vagococcus salmoninarum]|uniref:CCA tRNA nucleotidyltransferase n=1 Tax=Vagococcus salmoninarum TaxID=2739 RepID=UPI001881FF79|nr:CCA tRNA nucleotidyltransferase [Vagococcus salmoninarum]MBE9388183.1 CCA tRNA nucleotidyltransferase [Vagococcus salmoninarum]